jgi:hypothetical protein
MANKVRCPQGHFYNADRYSDCPTCNPDLLKSVSESIKETESFFDIASDSSGNPIEIKKDVVVEQEEIAKEEVNGEGIPSESGHVVLEKEPEKTDAVKKGEIKPMPEPKKFKEPKQPSPTSPLQAAVNDTLDHQDTDELKTVSIYNTPSGTEPVVGWLVCIKGEYFGQSFHLKNGQNFIGRAGNMDIVLAKELSVSRNKHCIIVFDSNPQDFYIQQGESSANTYLNGGIVLTPTKMKAQDKIGIGQGEFLFVPLCINDFRWEDLG